MFHRTLLSFLTALLTALLVALLGGEAHAGLKVVATTADLAAIAREVGGPSVEVTSLSLSTQDPHFVDAKPNLALALNKADLLIIQGLELEVGWLPVLQSGARNPRILDGADGFLDCSSAITPLEAPAGQVSRAQGDIHPGGNPHYLVDPRNGGKVAKAIAARLAKLDPAHAADFQRSAAELDKASADVAGRLMVKFAKLDEAKRKVVVYHRSWIYFEKFLSLVEVGAVEPKPGIPPDPAHIARTMGLMKSQGVKAILSEEYYPQTTSQLLADKTGAKLVVARGGAGASQRYLDRVLELGESTFAALSR